MSVRLFPPTYCIKLQQDNFFSPMDEKHFPYIFQNKKDHLKLNSKKIVPSLLVKFRITCSEKQIEGRSTHEPFRAIVINRTSSPETNAMKYNIINFLPEARIGSLISTSGGRSFNPLIVGDTARRMAYIKIWWCPRLRKESHDNNGDKGARVYVLARARANRASSMFALLPRGRCLAAKLLREQIDIYGLC